MKEQIIQKIIAVLREEIELLDFTNCFGIKNKYELITPSLLVNIDMADEDDCNSDVRGIEVSWIDSEATIYADDLSKYRCRTILEKANISEEQIDKFLID